MKRDHSPIEWLMRKIGDVEVGDHVADLGQSAGFKTFSTSARHLMITFSSRFRHDY
jgi:hypothetical protein